MYGGYASVSTIDKGNFSIYPNPSQGIVNVSATTMLDKIIILNINGQKVASVTNIHSTQTTFDLSNFSKGIYLVKIVAKDGATSVDKLIIE